MEQSCLRSWASREGFPPVPWEAVLWVVSFLSLGGFKQTWVIGLSWPLGSETGALMGGWKLPSVERSSSGADPAWKSLAGDRTQRGLTRAHGGVPREGSSLRQLRMCRVTPAPSRCV